jgi:uncharacterized protein
LAFADAGFLMVRDHTDKWIKLCLELGTDSQYTVVSAVSDPWSDDANGELIESNQCWLRIMRIGDLFGLHYSLDNNVWRFVKTFGMDMSQIPMVGFGVQSPNSNGCETLIKDF